MKILHTLTQLRQGETKFGHAPHKPILILSILDLLEKRAIPENEIPLEEELKEYFSENWGLLVNTGHAKNIVNPIFYLQTDKFWEVHNTKGKLTKGKAISTLKREGYKGIINEILFHTLCISENRDLARMIVLDTYFPKTKNTYFAAKKVLPSYINEIEKQIIESPKAEYRTKWTEVTGFVRDWKFSGKVKEVYDHTCCMSRYKIEYKEPVQHSLIEAAHIEPHSNQGNNHITNGFPLLVNLHRAFDSGLIGVNDKYEVVVNRKRFVEKESMYSLGLLHGEVLLPPENKAYFPSLEKLKKHRLYWGISER